MQKSSLEEKELNERIYNEPNNQHNLNPKSEIESAQIQNDINKLFFPIFSRRVICDSLPSQAKIIYLQKELRVANSDAIEFIVKELKGYYREITFDKNGNYFISDLIKVCEQKHRIQILEELSSTLSEDCLYCFATHPIQTLIDRSSSETEYKYILMSFNDYNKFLTASLDPNGCYTIKKIIERIPNRFRSEFNYIFFSFIGFTSKTKFGIITVKKFIACSKSDTINSLVMNFVRNNFMDLAVNQYANYLIQFLLELWNNTTEGNELKEMIFKNFQAMSEKKFSSFICELFIKIISEEEKIELIKTLDFDYMLKSNNKHSMKILKYLGFDQNHNKQFPFSLNNDFVNGNNKDLMKVI